MSDRRQYNTADALMASVTARARAASATGGMSVDQLIRQFEFSRILARVFASDSADQWVLKGGVAALVRIRDGRMTNDIDFLHTTRSDDLDKAVKRLENALALDLGDHFAFRIAEVDKIIGNTGRAGVAGRGISVAVESGKKRPNIHIDVVNESVMTQRPETTLAEALSVPGIIPPTVRLYPLVDHLADKISATRTVFGSGRPSSRVRDMVDLALFALSQSVEGQHFTRPSPPNGRTGTFRMIRGLNLRRIGAEGGRPRSGRLEFSLPMPTSTKLAHYLPGSSIPPSQARLMASLGIPRH